jgi:elongation factor P
VREHIPVSDREMVSYGSTRAKMSVIRLASASDIEGHSLAIDTSDFRNGLSFVMDNEFWTIIEFQHVKPGKGGAFVRTRLRKIKSGQVIEKTFRSGEKVEPAFIEKVEMQYLYKQGDDAIVMDLDTYEQIPIPMTTLGDQAKYLKEESKIIASVSGAETLGYELPNFMELEVTETDPGFKGDTVSGSNKPATLETGAVVQVPFHINIGDVIKVDTRTDSYLERVKK